MDVDEADAGPDVVMAPERDAGSDVPDLADAPDVPASPPRVYPPLYDPAIGADETSLPLCERPETTFVGPRGFVCSGLDDACGRGIREPEGCCRKEPRTEDTACGEGLACDGSGNCIARVGAPQERQGVIGREGWIDVRPPDQHATVWHVEPRGARLAFGVARAVELIPTGDEVISLEQIHIVNGRTYGVEAFAIVTPIVRRAFYFPDTTTEACVVVGDVDAMRDVRGDCTSPDTLRIACPSSGPISCEVFEGYGARVTGDDIGLAWVPGAALAGVLDMRAALVGPAYLGLRSSRTAPVRAAPTALLPPGDFIGCRPAECRVGQRTLCRNACGRPRTKSCDARTLCWNACPVDSEVCDGVDNDCDGAVDEDGASPICDDGLACTGDSCFDIVGRGRPICFHLAQPDACRPEVDQTCALPRCDGRGAPWPGNFRNDPPTPEDENGCSFLLRNDWCTETWNDCACDGAETCQQLPNGQDGSGCFASQPATGIGATWRRQHPCETDKEYCTTSVPTCCEPRGNLATCRNLQGLSDADLGLYKHACYSRSTALLRSGPRVGPTFESVRCMLDGLGGDPIETPAYHDDTPCTVDVCVEPVAATASGLWAPTITYTWRPGGTQAPPDTYEGRVLTGATCGTSPTVNQGCGRVQCTGFNFGSYGGVRGCLIVPAAGTECNAAGKVELPGIGGIPFLSTCMTYGCSGTPYCGYITHDELCVDSLACTTTACTGDTSSAGGDARVWGCSVTTDDSMCPDHPADPCLAPVCSNRPAGQPSGTPGCWWVPDFTMPECAPP